MARRGGGLLTALAVVLSVAVLAVGAGLLYLVVTGGAPGGQGAPRQEAGLERKGFSEYDWDELAQVAQMIAEAPSDEEGRAVADEWGVHVGDARPLPLADGTQAQLVVVGIRHDRRADGSGVAGLTLMTSPIARRAVNPTDTNAGGWETSDLRAWLASDGAALLPDDLASNLVEVTKLTNNTGATSDAASVTQTADALWLFSLTEVCGPVDLFATEYGDEVRARTYYIDYTAYDELLSQEGSQYEYFADAGVTDLADASGTLALTYGGSACAWWYRSPYPLTFDMGDEYFFYQVMDSGYPVTLGYASQPAGVVAGLCL